MTLLSIILVILGILKIICIFVFLAVYRMLCLLVCLYFYFWPFIMIYDFLAYYLDPLWLSDLLFSNLMLFCWWLIFVALISFILDYYIKFLIEALINRCKEALGNIRLSEEGTVKVIRPSTLDYVIKFLIDALIILYKATLGNIRLSEGTVKRKVKRKKK